MPPVNKPIEIVCFDIGGTLGERAANNSLTPFPSSAGLLSAMRNELELRIGIIMTLGPLSNDQAKLMLQQAGLAALLDPQGFVSEHDTNGVAKPHRAIYEKAAQKAGVPMGKCLFVGENLIEVIGARAAGMQALLKPSPPGRELP